MSGETSTFLCGHARDESNTLWFRSPRGKNGRSSRCRTCHKCNVADKARAGSGALKLVIALHVEGVLSEGQVCAVTGLGRIGVRELADAHRDNSARVAA